MTQSAQQVSAPQQSGGQQSIGQPPAQGYGQPLPTGAAQAATVGQPSPVGGSQSYQAGMAQPTSIGQQPQQPGFGQQPQQPGFGQSGASTAIQQPTTANLKLEEAISDEMRVALHDFVQAATTSSWCAEQCLEEGPQMAECIRLCRDTADLATLNLQLLSRDSVFGPEVAEVFATAAEACAQECRQHSQRHCQECAEVLDRAARSTRKMLTSFASA